MDILYTKEEENENQNSEEIEFCMEDTVFEICEDSLPGF